MIAAERLERLVGIENLVVSVAVEQLRRLVVEDLAQQRGDRLALVEPLPPKRRQGLCRDRLVERDEARDPAIAEVLVMEGIEDARPAEARKAENSEREDMKVNETRLQPPDQRCVGKDTVTTPCRLGSSEGRRVGKERG